MDAACSGHALVTRSCWLVVERDGKKEQELDLAADGDAGVPSPKYSSQAMTVLKLSGRRFLFMIALAVVLGSGRPCIVVSISL
jgi:hypothetical protein